MMKYVTYVLYSDKCKRLYIGQTDNLERRLREHNKGKVASTKPYMPYRLIYSETFNIREESVKREKELKKTESRRMLRKML
jgi:putative endonuclease